MNTRIIENVDENALREAAAIIKNGGLVAFPTIRLSFILQMPQMPKNIVLQTMCLTSLHRFICPDRLR